MVFIYIFIPWRDLYKVFPTQRCCLVAPYKSNLIVTTQSARHQTLRLGTSTKTKYQSCNVKNKLSTLLEETILQY